MGFYLNKGIPFDKKVNLLSCYELLL